MSQILYLQLSRESDVNAYQQAERAVAKELGTDTDELPRPAVIRELSEAYCGGDAVGAWKNGDADG